MAAVYGNLMLPTAQRTSQLVNDTRFSSIREYILDSNSLSGATQLEISDLSRDSVIYRIDLIVTAPFNTLDGAQHNIEVADQEGNILMDNDWNDPNMIGTYSTNCYSIMNGSNTKLTVTHDLSNISSGAAILRLYVYDTVSEYVRMLTSDSLYYHTMDNIGVNVVKT